MPALRPPPRITGHLRTFFPRHFSSSSASSSAGPNAAASNTSTTSTTTTTESQGTSVAIGGNAVKPREEQTAVTAEALAELVKIVEKPQPFEYRKESIWQKREPRPAPTLYEHLLVSEEASQEGLKDAFRNVAKNVHPDVLAASGSDITEAQAKAIFSRSTCQRVARPVAPALKIMFSKLFDNITKICCKSATFFN